MKSDARQKKARRELLHQWLSPLLSILVANELLVNMSAATKDLVASFKGPLHPLSMKI
jgi:hypothetical protein